MRHYIFNNIVDILNDGETDILTHTEEDITAAVELFVSRPDEQETMRMALCEQQAIVRDRRNVFDTFSANFQKRYFTPSSLGT